MVSSWKLLAALVGVFFLTSPASAQWGDLKLRFVLADPDVKPRGAPIVQKDCQQVQVPDESLIVNNNAELANVMVWLETNDPESVPIHPEVANKANDTKPLMETKDCRFVPRCLIASAGQTIVFENRDKFGHNWNPAFTVNRKISRAIPANGTEDWPVPKRESRVADVSCSIHPWMKSSIMVAPTPYHGISATDGLAAIEKLPPAQWTFRVWHEAIGYVKYVELDGKQTEWSKGIATFAVRPDDNEVHTVKILPAPKR
jgi:plastocyanin